jgi:hypothetical protein
MPGEPTGENGCASLNSAEFSSAMTSMRRCLLRRYLHVTPPDLGRQL